MYSPPRSASAVTAASQHSGQVSIPLPELRRLMKGWLLDCEYRQLSERTMEGRRKLVQNFLWWLQKEDANECGPLEIRGFISYVSAKQPEKGGRFGNPHLCRPLRPRTVKDYHGNLRTMFLWMAQEGFIECSPMENLKAPIARADQIQPFTEEQVASLIRAARRMRHAKRDELIVLFLLDTGMRASEFCGLRVEDVDVVSRKGMVLGKGNKHRAVYFGRETGRLLWQYLRARGADAADPLFVTERGEAFTRSGLLQLIERLGRDANLQGVRCSPHTFRHTFAVMFLRSGGSVFALKEMMGHTTLEMTQRYVALAAADVQNQHQQFSPVERIRGKRRKAA